MSTCIACEPGEALIDTFTNLGFKCEGCPVNTYTDNGIFCEECPGGHFSEERSTKCTPCEIGKYRARGSSDKKCLNCPAGKTTAKEAAITINECN